MSTSNIKSSFTQVAEQITNYNKNVIALLTQLNNIVSSSSSSIAIPIDDGFGVINEFNLPTIGFLKSELDRLNNNINSLYNINDTGAVIQTGVNKFHKIITIDLNREPNAITTLNTINTFSSKKNWFFESLMNPMLVVDIDLNGKVENSVRKALIRRYIVKFNVDAVGTITPLGQGALNSFNTLFNNKNNIDIVEFDTWHKTTSGIVNGSDPIYDEDVFDLEPNQLEFDGIFSVLKFETDTLNNKFWYHLDTLDYITVKTGDIKQLTLNDELIINVADSSTRYKIVEISTASSNNRIRVERMEGVEPIPIGVGTLKFYSPLVYNKLVKVGIGYNEYNLIFAKPMDAETHLLSKTWSKGTAFFTNNLRLSDNTSDNGLSMEQYYIDRVNDYGKVLDDLVEKKIPANLGATPNPPVLNINNFKTVQINKHLTDTPDSNALKTKHNEQKNIKFEISQLTEAISDKSKQASITKFNSAASKSKFDNELDELIKKKESKSKLLSSTVNDILNIDKLNASIKTEARFKIRGFWDMPEALLVKGTRPQEIVQFVIQYKYLSKDNKENPVESFKIKDPTQTIKDKNASFSNWIEIKTDVRKRTRNAQTGEYTWEIEDVSNADTPNINQLDLTIQPNEKIELRVRSVSEVGYPESPVLSDWSESIVLEFPDDLKNVLGDKDFILKEATQEELKVRMETELGARGLNDVLNQVVTINNKKYTASAEKTLSGFKDSNSNPLDLYEYLVKLENRVKDLEEKIKNAKGELKITIFRNNSEFVVKNGSEVEFNIECEDYLDVFTDTSVPTGRVFANNIYVIKDFVIKIENVSAGSPLSLLSNRNYYNNSDFFNNSAPQTFWVNEQHELLYNNSTGSTRTQLDNQYLWSANYISVATTNVAKLADNIGNTFTTSNSLTSITGLTEYNIGYSDTSSLSFVGNNTSLLEIDKWVDAAPSVSSANKLLTSIHLSTPRLTDITETNTDKLKTVKSGGENAVIVPINIYFKLNALNPTAGTGNNYQYVNMNNSTNTVRHIKRVKMFLENEAENRPFVFTVKFTINRSKVVVQKIATSKVNLLQ